MKALPASLATLTLAAVVLSAGCASRAPQTKNALLIDGQTLNSLLPAGERQAIDKRIPASYRGSVLIAQAIGRILATHQKVAVEASDAYLAQADKNGPKLAGWLVTRHAAGLEVLFIATDNGQPRIVATARDVKAHSANVTQLESPRPLDAEQAAMWRARGLAFQADMQACSRHYHPVVFPVSAAGSKQIYVYLLPLAPAGEIMLGGYYRIKINAEATRIVDSHGFTRRCLQVRRNPKAIGAGVTEDESLTPTPPQVYANLRYGLPIYVKTTKNHLKWKIADGRISLIKATSGK